MPTITKKQLEDYGHIDDTSSFAISLYKEYRGLELEPR